MGFPGSLASSLISFPGPPHIPPSPPWGPGHILPSLSTAQHGSQRSKGNREGGGRAVPPEEAVGWGFKIQLSSPPQNKSREHQAAGQAARTHHRSFLDSGLAAELGVSGNDVRSSWKPCASRQGCPGFDTNPSEPINCVTHQETRSKAGLTSLEAKSELMSNVCPLIAGRWNLESLPRKKFF